MNEERSSRMYTIQDVRKHLEKVEKTRKEREQEEKSKEFSAQIRKRWKRRDDKYVMGRQDYCDCEMMMNNLVKLELFASRDEKKKAFAEFFESALVGSFLRYRSSKKKTWGRGQNVLLVIAAPTVSALYGVGIALLSAEDSVLAGAPLPIVMGAAVVGVLAAGYTRWHGMKNDRETWVRHSVCYNRLNLLLQRFILSAQSEEDYNALVRDAFGILEQNLDQFTLNMSANGLAQRAGKGEKEDD